MTALTLDVRAPIVVLAGDFNAAIFQLGWVGTHLFGMPEGAEIQAQEVVIQADVGLLQLLFLEGVALNVTPTRIELFAVDSQPATLSKVEEVLGRIVEVLPHTPIRAIGCNFQYTDAEPDPTVMDLFDTPEAIEAEYRVTARQASVQVELDNSILNFTRASSGNAVRFIFNYHRAESEIAAYAAFIPGLVARNLEHSAAFVRSLYRYDGYATVGFFTAREQEDIADANETAPPRALAHEQNGQDQP
jgi:hypothetical protein